MLITSETFDDDGGFVGRSVAVKTETLVAADEERYTLRSETVVQVGGKRLPGPTQEQTLYLLTDSSELPAAVSDEGPTTITLQGNAVRCQTIQMEFPGEQGNRVETLFFSSEEPPRLVRRQRIDYIDGEPESELVMNLLRVRVPVRIGAAIDWGWHTSELRKMPGGARVERFRIHNAQIPGAVLVESTAGFESTGARLRWTVSELQDWGYQPGVSANLDPERPADGELQPLRPRQLLRMLRRGETPGAEDSDG